MSESLSSKIKEEFRKWDVSGDGVIGREELAKLLLAISPQLSADMIDSLLTGLSAGSTEKVRYEALIDELSGNTKSAQPYLPPRPPGAHGSFLRIITINDVYSLTNYPRVATAVATARRAASVLDCVVTSHLNGDFLSPCLFTALDGGNVMMEGLNRANIDYVCLGNHEFDGGFARLAEKAKLFKGQIINSNCANPEIAHFPRYHTFAVGGRTVVLAGLVTGRKDIYCPCNCPEVVPIPEACEKVWEEAKSALNMVPDLFLPMTHQDLAEDRATCSALSDHPELGHRMPVVLGGHEHLAFIEEAGKSLIVKVGIDAEKIGIVDVWWTASGTLRCSCTFVPAENFPEDPEAISFVNTQVQFLNRMMGATIASLPMACSSKTVRLEPSALASFLLSLIKRGLKKDGVELVLLQGGAVRGKRDYVAGPFTLGDLYNEFGFEIEQAVVALPGEVIVASILNSRTGHGEMPNFLHADGDAEISSNHELLKINGKPIDPGRMYIVSIYRALLSGMNRIEPLASYAKASLEIPDAEVCYPAKEICVDVCMKEFWRQLVGFNQWDSDGDSDVSIAELKAGVNSAIARIDTNGDGMISSSELCKILQEKGMEQSLLENMMQALDTTGDGNISREELIGLAF